MSLERNSGYQPNIRIEGKSPNIQSSLEGSKGVATHMNLETHPAVLTPPVETDFDEIAVVPSEVNDGLLKMNPGREHGINVTTTTYEFEVPTIRPIINTNIPEPDTQIEPENADQVVFEHEEDYETVVIDGQLIRRRKKKIPPEPNPDGLDSVFTNVTSNLSTGETD